MIISQMASSVDPDEIAHYEPSGSTHCLHRHVYSVERV